jgi:hypothetical protein
MSINKFSRVNVRDLGCSSHQKETKEEGRVTFRMAASWRWNLLSPSISAGTLRKERVRENKKQSDNNRQQN